MTRFGWGVAVALLLLGAAFISVTRFGMGGGVGHTPTLPAPVDGALLAVPVAGFPRAALRDSWGDAREGGVRGHHGTDIIAPARTPVIAAAAGRVEKLFQSARGGITVYVRSPDRRWTYYYAHLAGYAGNLREGQAVKRGTLLGFVGDTGDAGPGNYHLHFGLTRMRPEERWWQGEDVDPYPILAAGRLPR